MSFKIHDTGRQSGLTHAIRLRSHGFAAQPRQPTPLKSRAVFDLYKRLGFGAARDRSLATRVAVVAAVLAHIRTDASPNDSGYRAGFAEMLGGKRSTHEPAALSGVYLRQPRIGTC